MAAHQGCVSDVIELDGDPPSDHEAYQEALKALFEADSVQVW